ncbi:MAG: thermosome subunit beta [Candidatus Anstonellales archaeon]
MAQRISSEPLPENAQRIIGRDAMRLNIAIGYAIAQIVKTTLGPKGMDKMLVSDIGDIVITNDGATILEEMNVEHPTAKIMVEIAKTQDKEVGDGTTTSVVIAGNLLRNAGNLLDKNIHPTTIIKGYEAAEAEARRLLDELSVPLKLDDTDVLKRIALVSMGSKGIGSKAEKEHIVNLIIEAIKLVAEKRNDSITIDVDNIKLEKKAGADVMSTELVKGIVIDKEIVHPGMPKYVKNAKIALLDAPLEIEKTETDAKININAPEQLEAFLKQEETMIRKMVEKIKASGANVVFVQKGIDDLAQHYLAKEGIAAIRRVKRSDMEKLAKATGARIVSTIDDLSAKDLGIAGIVEEKKLGGEAMVFVQECRDPKSVTIFVRGGTEHVVNEVERAIKDAIGAVSSALEDGSYVVGGGSIEMALAKRLREFATKTGGREQLAIEAFAEALESIPTTLAENGGLDAIDVLVELRTKHAQKGNETYGVDVIAGKIADMKKQGIFEPTKVKRQAIASATEAARLILRIDDIISGKGTTGKKQGNEGGEMPSD